MLSPHAYRFNGPTVLIDGSAYRFHWTVITACLALVLFSLFYFPTQQGYAWYAQDPYVVGIIFAVIGVIYLHYMVWSLYTTVSITVRKDQAHIRIKTPMKTRQYTVHQPVLKYEHLGYPYGTLIERLMYKPLHVWIEHGSGKIDFFPKRLLPPTAVFQKKDVEQIAKKLGLPYEKNT